METAAEDGSACPICREPTRAMAVPVRVEREGRVVLRLEAPARACDHCDTVSVEDEVVEELIAALEEHTRPGDDIIFPGGVTLH